MTGELLLVFGRMYWYCVPSTPLYVKNWKISDAVVRIPRSMTSDSPHKKVKELTMSRDIWNEHCDIAYQDAKRLHSRRGLQC